MRTSLMMMLSQALSRPSKPPPHLSRKAFAVRSRTWFVISADLGDPTQAIDLKYQPEVSPTLQIIAPRSLWTLGAVA
jgi:hypothetical protein